ncbi:MAG: 16S rRNA (guanine(527)-N(7))-methyltransferase RsmG [Lachnospiraceae bacterium]|nr:16S rRNA (guanine(527)-N(7))-methyltransferase RsmG [Lachnospiraceae bacterium]
MFGEKRLNHSFNHYNLQQFYKDLTELHITLSDAQAEQFIQYYEMLIEKNKVMNLTAITDFDEVLMKHFVDSLSLVKAFDLDDAGTEVSLIDIGTGAGFPGIPIKIAFPRLKVTLMDSLNKRVDFLNEVIGTLKLDGIDAIHGRAEDFAKPEQLREKYDLCVSRAVANLSVLSEYCLPYVKVGGKFISYKSEKVAEELQEAEHAIDILGGKVEDQIAFTLPDSDIYRNLVVIDKISETPLKYPRKAGTASKKPLK